MRKYFAILHAAFRDGARNPGAVLSTGIFLCLVLYVFRELWNAVAAGHEWKAAPQLLVWYLAITELPTMSPPRVISAVEQDISSGAFALNLIRPAGYFRQKLCELVGQMLFRFLAVASIGTLAAYAFTWDIPAPVPALLAAAILALVGSLIATVQQLTLAASALWLDEVSPLLWLWQKLLFIFGGLMIPLQFYPAPLNAAALLTPFSAMLYGPASLLFQPEITRVLEVAAQQFFWLLLSLLLLRVVSRRAIRHAIIEGKG